MTFACRVYEPPEEMPDPENGKSNEAFWKKLALNFEKTIELLKRDFQFQETEAIYVQQQELKTLTEQHPLSRMCRSYARLANKTLNSESLLNNTCAELIQQAELGLKEEDIILEQIQTLRECKEVISWYLLFVAAKIGRALMGKMDGWEDASMIQSDMNGSAKIAMIGIERSMQAWVQIFNITQEEDQIFPLLQMLAEIKRLAGEEFPRAEEFVRPGFDAPPEAE